MEFEVFITAHPKDFAVLPNCIRSILDFVTPRPESVTIVAKERSGDLERILKATGSVFLREDAIISDCKRNSMPTITFRSEDRTGWYFQQFLKLGIARLSRRPFYMVADADTLFIRTTPLYRENKMILYRTGQHHLPYFKTFTKLFGFSPEKQKSFIANYMLMNARIVQEMTRQIEDETDKRWHEVILEAIDRNTMSSFSEYETYGYFLSRFYPESFVSERSATLNLFSFLYPFHDLIQQLARARFHSIAYHNYRR